MEQQGALQLLQQRYNKLQNTNRKLREEIVRLENELNTYKAFIGGTR